MPATCQTTTAPVSYIEAYPDQLPGVLHFACPRLHATLTPESCAARHGLALGDTHGQFSACRNCAIGRVHATGQQATLARLSELVSTGPMVKLCVRCGHQRDRRVGPICISCYNRELEAKKGRNAKGKPPVTYAPLRLRRVGLELPDGEIHWVLFEAQTWLEPLLRGLKVYPGAKLYDGQPSNDSPWNEAAQRFEYRNEQGQALAMDVLPQVDHQLVRYRAALPGELPAPVVAGVSLFDPGAMEIWLNISGEGQATNKEWRALDYGCSTCRQGVMQARRRAGQLTVRCSGCGEAETQAVVRLMD